MLSWTEWQSYMESSYNFMPKWYWNNGLRRKVYQDYIDSRKNKKIDNNTILTT
jgi:hypothetical protein